MTVVVLVPWRGGDELREQSWDITRPYLEALGFPIYTGDSPTNKWSRAAACNAAARAAGSWAVAIVADADTIPDPAAITAAIARVRETAGAVRPHDHLWRLTPSGSIAFAKLGAAGIERRHIARQHAGGGLLVIARRAWDTVGGYDTRFVGWGHEDTVFNIALATRATWERVPGNAWHLWHPEPSRDTREYQRNQLLLAQVRRKHQAALARLDQRARWKVSAVL